MLFLHTHTGCSFMFLMASRIIGMFKESCEAWAATSTLCSLEYSHFPSPFPIQAVTLRWAGDLFAVVGTAEHASVTVQLIKDKM